MSDLTRRDVLLTTTVGIAAIAASVGVAGAEEKKAAPYTFEGADPSKSCRLLARAIDDTTASAKVVAGIVNDSFILLVKGKKPYANMRVQLSPLTYIRRPEYWGIEVIGCIPGLQLPAIGAYDEFLPLDGIRGTKGVEVVWANGVTEKIDVPPRP